MPVEPGIFDCTLKVQPLQRISPSRYQSLRACALSEVWSSGRQPRLLPSSAASHVGTVTHRLLQAAATGELNVTDAEAVLAKWEALVHEEEATMASSWIERHLVPLKSSVMDYEIRRLRACSAVSHFASSTSYPRSQGGRTSGRVTGSEIRVASADGSMVGFIDLVCESTDGLVLRDYKSGDIWEQSQNGNARAIKQSYQLQLKLYAALYQCTFGMQPSTLELVGLSGEVKQIPVDLQECRHLLDEAINLLRSVNAIIKEMGSSIGALEERLAIPNNTSCRFCTFRPGCRQYIKSRNYRNEFMDWLADAVGVCKEVRPLRNNTMMAVIEDRACTAADVYIRGLSADPYRHPVLSGIVRDSKVGLFNLGTTSQGGSFLEAQSTVIYKYMVAVTD